jgi:ribonucleoside-diphosphate reductase subunit M2
MTPHHTGIKNQNYIPMKHERDDDVEEQSALFKKRELRLFPIQEKPVWDMYKIAESAIWHVSEIDLMHDKVDWKKLTDDERYFIKNVLAFFAASDLIVTDNLTNRFIREVELIEARTFLQFQVAIENIHTETYAQLIDTLIQNPDEKEHLFSAIKTMDWVAKKADWAQTYIHSDASFGERVIGFICVEGIFFSGSFCAIFWLKKRGLMPGLTFSNELISRDEALHVEFGMLMFSMLPKSQRPSEEKVVEIMKSCVEIEHEFVKKALPVSLIGMNEGLMCEYICFCCDVMMTKLGFNKIYNAKNPFDWMELISLQGKTNFFEKRVGEYAKAGVGQETISKDDKKFALDADF